MEAQGWPGVERYFDWSFYSQGTGESRQTSSDLFTYEALEFFDDPEPTKGSPWERGERLAGLVRRHRTLLILDGIEPLQYPLNDPQAGRLKDQALEALRAKRYHELKSCALATMDSRHDPSNPGQAACQRFRRAGSRKVRSYAQSFCWQWRVRFVRLG
jgi:hypothetical protein